MKKGNYILDEQLLGVPHSLFSGSNGYDSQEFLLFINSTEDLNLKAYNFKGIHYFERCLQESSAGQDFFEQVVHPEDYPFFIHFMRSCEDLDTGEEREITVRLRSPFGYWKKFKFKTRTYSGFEEAEEKFVLSIARALDSYKYPYRKSTAINLETEKSLQESLNRYRVLINSLDDGFSVLEMIFDIQQRPVDYLFVEINPAFEKHIHLQNILGKTMKELSHTHHKKWFDTYGRVVVKGEAIRFEEYAEDLKTWFDVYAFPIGNRKSRKVAILCSDISQRKEVEENLKKINETLESKVRKRTNELKEKNDLLQMVFDTVSQGIFIMKPRFGENKDIIDFTYVRVNKRIKRYYRLNNLTGRSFLDLNPQAGKTGAFEIFKQTMLTGKSKDFEVCFKRKGKKTWFKMSARRQKGLLITSLENVTHKKTRAQNLKDNIRFKKQLIDTTPDVIFIFNLYEEKVRYMNRDLCEKHGGRMEDIVGMPLLNIIPLIHPQDRQKALDFHNKLMKGSDKDVFEFEFRLEGNNGNWDFYNARGKVFMRNKKGNPYEYIILLRNVQEQKKTQQALLHAEKLSIKGEIARTLAHELRNPLASIGVSADILNKKTEKLEQKDLLNYINIIKRSTTRLNNLVTELLTSSNYSPAVLKKCCLAQTMDDVLEQAKDRIYLAGIKILKSYKGHYYIMADKEKLKIALLNIVVNASEAMAPNKGVLDINIYKVDGRFKLVIADNGIGMEKDQIENLFESFYTNKSGGMGIGLSSVKNILHDHQATVEVESEPKKGTTFILSFPRFSK